MSVFTQGFIIAQTRSAEPADSLNGQEVEGRKAVSNNTNNAVKNRGLRLSLDAWAVIVAFALALAVRLDIFKKVPW